MRRGYRLTPAAQASVRGILRWTLERFGERQAEAYEARLLSAFARLADGALPGRSARAEWGAAVPEDLRFVRVGSHVVLFRERDGQVEVVNVLHGRMDLSAWARA